MKREYREQDYQVIFGIKKETFDAQLKILEIQFEEDHKKGGRKDGLTPKERLEIYWKYSRQYFSQRYLAAKYGISKSQISPTITWVAKTLAKNIVFTLPNRVKNMEDHSENRIIDATESRIDRPKKHHKKWYSGKKKMCTIKTQIEIGEETEFIYSIDFARGNVHDFKLWKQSKKDCPKNKFNIADLGYHGMDKIHENSITPIKSSKYHKLSKEEKWYNKELSKVRITVEHVNAWLKKFKMFSTRYRGRRKKFTLFMTLLCGTYNYEHANL